MPWTPPPPMLCYSCEKKVYPLEFLSVDGNIYHKNCFKCLHCTKVLSLGNYASLKEKLYCKPHFTQIFKEKGNLTAFGEEHVIPPSPARPPSAEQAEPPSQPTPPPPVRRPEDFQSGFAPEYVPTKISKLGGGQCAKCKTKVFPIGKVDAESSVWHMHCFRCATCSCQLDAESYKFSEQNLYCFKHGPREY